MKELVVFNIKIVADALKANAPEAEAQQLVNAINEVISGWDSSPTLLFNGAVIAEYQENGE